MGKKKRSDAGVEEPNRSHLKLIIAAVVIVLVAVAAGSIIGTILLVGVDDDADVAASVPAFVADAPEIERSSVADLLSSKSFEEMTPEELDEVKAEVQRVFDDAEFRVTGPGLDGIDLVRRNGDTIISRQYATTDAPGGPTPLEVTTFYCASDDGVDTYKTRRTSAGTTNDYGRLERDEPPLERILEDTDWIDPRDLGTREIDGRTARGIIMIYVGDAARVPAEAWFDVENARVLKYFWYGPSRKPSYSSNWEFDWRVPPRIEPDPDLETPPCFETAYRD